MKTPQDSNNSLSSISRMVIFLKNTSKNYLPRLGNLNLSISTPAQYQAGF